MFYFWNKFNPMTRFLWLPAIAILFCGGCLPKADSAPDLDLSTQYLTDINAQPMGIKGTGVLEDHKREVWLDWERQLMAPADTIALPNGDTGAVALILFPNPAVTSMMVAVQSSDSVALKMAVVNRKKQTFGRWATRKGPGNSVVNLDLQPMRQSGDSLFRLYYSFSTRSHPDFFTSHADFTISY
jgi:hypothetical protein